MQHRMLFECLKQKWNQQIILNDITRALINKYYARWAIRVWVKEMLIKCRGQTLATRKVCKNILKYLERRIN